MPKFLLKIRYNGEGIKGTMSEGFAQREAYLRTIGKSMGFTFDAVYWGLGEDDAYFLVDGPSESVIASSLMGSASGTGKVTTVPLFSAAEMDAIAAKIPSYRSPGG